MRRLAPMTRWVVAILVLSSAMIVESVDPSQGVRGPVPLVYHGLGLIIIKDVVYASPGGHALRLDIYMPTHRSSLLPGVLLLHGGGFVVGDKTWVAWEAKITAMTGMVTFSANYRLAPEYPFPAAVQDAQAAVAWIRQHAGDYGVDPTRIGAMGFSAGGEIAGELAASGTGPLDQGSRVAAAVSWSGLLNLRSLALFGSAVDKSIVANYLQCGPNPESTCPDKVAAASPTSLVDPSDSPMHLGNALDEYIPYTQATMMAKKLTENGIFEETLLVPGSCHSIQCKGKQIIETLGFLKTKLGVSDGEVP
jgi:acetyl esterase